MTVRRPGTTLAAAALAAALAGGAVAAAGDGARAAAGPVFSHPAQIDNPYLPITKFKRCEIRGRSEDGTRTRGVRTVQDATRPFEIGGRRVEAVVVQDDAYEDSKLVERTLDYFAQSDDGTVFYLGEHVKNIRSGKVVDTDGTWLYGKDTDRLGVAMPARPKVGDQFHLEDVPGVTMESNRVEEMGLRAEVGGRIVDDVIRVSEFIQPEGESEHKTYARGVGLIAEYAPDGTAFFAGCR